MFRRQLVEILASGPRSASSIAREMGLTRRDIETDLAHAIRTARGRGHTVYVLPARCRTCDFTFGEDRLLKPSRCPACKGTRLHEALVSVVRTE